MSLIYTEGYLSSIEVGASTQQLEPNIKNLILVPPVNNMTAIKIDLYETHPYEPSYTFRLLTNEVKLKNLKQSYKISTDSEQKIKVYYEKDREEDLNDF